jgi:hypothetical protein
MDKGEQNRRAILKILDESKVTAAQKSQLISLIFDLSLEEYQRGMSKASEIYESYQKAASSKPKRKKANNPDLFASE